MNEELKRHPQNPFESFVVQASAGSGKTYQLSRRFLYLVAAGSPPEEILTITFTRKAAQEMKERIKSLAQQLLVDSSFQKEISETLRSFAQASQYKGRLLSPQAVAQKICQVRAELKITTIDSVFHEWFQRFYIDQNRPVLFEKDLTMASPLEREQCETLAWQKVCLHLKKLKEEKTHPDFLDFYLESEGLFALHNRLKELARHETFLWLNAFTNGGEWPILPYEDGRQTIESDRSVIDCIRGDLTTIAEVMNPKITAALQNTLVQNQLEPLLTCGLITANGWKVSGTYLKGKKKEQFFTEISRIEEALKNHVNHKRLLLLNAQAALYKELYSLYIDAYQKAKDTQHLMEFPDLAKSAHELMNALDFAGSRYLIQYNIKHMMIDEFQDTSHLQWDIFKTIIEEMLSGSGIERESSAPSTCFIVGDTKQSIYGFREADPEILRHCGEELCSLGVHSVALSTSYRSAQGIMDYVNHYFAEKLPEFPIHQSAQSKGEFHAPQEASITVFPLVEDEEETEAQKVAAHCAALLRGEKAARVFDAALGDYRPPRPSDIALLFRKGTHLPAFLDAFQEHDIPFIVDGELPLQESIPWCDFQQLIHFLSFPYDPVALLTLVKSPLIGCPDHLLWEWLRQEDEVESILEYLRNNEKYSVWSKLLDQKFVQEPGTKLRLLNDVYSDPHIVSRYLSGLPDATKTSLLADIRSIQNFLLNMESEGHTTFPPLLEKLRVFFAGDTTGLYRDISVEAVRFMTIHKSKGLEFPIVGLIDTASKWEKSDPYWLRGGADQGMYFVGTKNEQPFEHAPFDALKEFSQQKLKQESQRLVYVALTRAQNHLFISATAALRLKPDIDIHNACRQALDDLAASSGFALIEENDAFVWEQRDLKTYEPPAHTSQSPLDSLPQANHQLKYEIVTVKPSSQNKVYGATENLSEIEKEARRLEGLYIHTLLEHADDTPDAHEVWQETLEQHAAEPKLWLKHNYQPMYHQFERLIASPLWRSLQAQGRFYHELAFCYLEDGALLRGSIDLVIIGPDGSGKVIDFKSRESLDQQSAQAYAPQLKVYKNAAERLFPEVTFSASVLSTSQPAEFTIDY